VLYHRGLCFDDEKESYKNPNGVLEIAGIQKNICLSAMMRAVKSVARKTSTTRSFGTWNPELQTILSSDRCVHHASLQSRGGNESSKPLQATPLSKRKGKNSDVSKYPLTWLRVGRRHLMRLVQKLPNRHHCKTKNQVGVPIIDREKKRYCGFAQP